MASYTIRHRLDEIHYIWKNNQWLFAVVGFLIGMLFFPFAKILVQNLEELMIGLVPEAIGLAFTVLLIDRLSEKRAEDRLKQHLIREAGGQSNEIAKTAVNWMHSEGWLGGENGLLKAEFLLGAALHGADLERTNLQGSFLKDANLKGADLRAGNLENANLMGANLQDVDAYRTDLKSAFLYEANLQNINLCRANLEEAELLSVNLRGAQLQEANLKGADLWDADLQDADLSHANLQGAFLMRANLQGAQLQDAEFDEKTVLPDARYDRETKTHKKHWTSDTDMNRYTDPKHPDFWYGYRLYGKDLSGRDYSNANLENALLGGMNLESADLAGANLAGANLMGANLQNANLVLHPVSGLK